MNSGYLESVCQNGGSTLRTPSFQDDPPTPVEHYLNTSYRSVLSPTKMCTNVCGSSNNPPVHIIVHTQSDPPPSFESKSK
mmetsp:Transcript_64237/g.77216  ORF Transcript_64237/g.77216 Transcript_64237/m.77216 type:complete len:80 (-) Transcript_64237:163-402(-)